MSVTIHKGIVFNPGTQEQVIELICTAVEEKKRYRVDYGSPDTGDSFGILEGNEGYFVKLEDGRVGLASTKRTAPTPVNTSQVVVVWDMTGAVVYRHPWYSARYEWSTAEIKKRGDMYGVFVHDRITTRTVKVAAYADEGQAIRWLSRVKSFDPYND